MRHPAIHGVALVALLASGCDRLKGLAKSEDAGVAVAASGGTPAPPPTAASKGGSTKPEEENLLGVAAGVVIVDQTPPDTSSWDHDAHLMLDDDPETSWNNAPGGKHVVVLALPQRTILKRFTWKGHAKRVAIEASDDAMGKKNFQKIAEATLSAAAEQSPQTIAATKEVTARSVRLTLENADEHAPNDDVRGFGTKVDDPGWGTKNLTGHFRTVGGSELYLRQVGSMVRGCWASHVVVGTVDGNIVKAQVSNEGQGPGDAAILNLAPDGSRAYLFKYRTDRDLNFFEGRREAPAAPSGECELADEKKAAAAPDPIASDIEKFGRARIYGIRFDTDSDVIKPESKPVLDRVTAVLKAKPDWKLTVEGHTDNTATPAYNQGLSDRRAKAVKKWLEGQGIAGARLNPVGVGQTKPVASNDSAIGRAENRRVELVKQ